MPDYKVGDIALVRFHPAYGQELKKYRPAVIVATQRQGLDERFVTIVPFSFRDNVDNTLEMVIENQVLMKKSLLLCWYWWTVDKQRVVKILGNLGDKDWQRARRKIIACVG